MSYLGRDETLTPANRAFLQRKHKLLIDGNWVEARSGKDVRGV